MSVRPHPVWPQRVVLHQATGQLELTWSDQLSHRFEAVTLRSACRCAPCEQARRGGTSVPVPADLRLQSLHEIGDIGLQLRFSDGHDRGIYPWAYLHELAQREAITHPPSP